MKNIFKNNRRYFLEREKSSKHSAMELADWSSAAAHYLRNVMPVSCRGTKRQPKDKAMGLSESTHAGFTLEKIPRRGRCGELETTLKWKLILVKLSMHGMETIWAVSESILGSDPGTFLWESTHKSDVFRHGSNAVLPRGRAMDSNTL